MNQDIGTLSANALRILSMDGVQQAKSGHPGMPMGMADAAYVLWTQFLKHNPADPTWPDRDRFVLSAGHGSMLIYSLLYLTGYDVSLDDLKSFRQWGSKTPGHPEYGHTPGVETTTGPLGQGISTAVGMALAERHLAAIFNRPDFPLVEHHTYVIAGDGDLMEGVSHEACSLAGHLKLGRLIVLYDSNRITIDGSIDLSCSDDVVKRFEAYGWQVQEIDGHNQGELRAAIEQARANTDQPSMIVCHSHIGFGSPNKQDKAKAHGEPLGDEEIVLTRAALGWSDETRFQVPDEITSHMRESAAQGAQRQHDWEDLLARYRAAHPDLAAQWDAMMERRLPDNLADLLPTFAPDAVGVASRAASGQVINALAAHIPALIGGSADLHASNNTLIKSSEPLQASNYAARNVYYGIREHAMGTVMNGMALHGGLIPFGGTFLVFSDYMKPAVRMAAMMKQQVIYVFTHDSIGLGEDGPTHQPIEHVHALRIIPDLYTMRPGDANEVAMAWRFALEKKDAPTALVLTRQAIPTFDRSGGDDLGALAPAEGLLRGAYVLYSPDNPQIILMASGSEVSLALDAARLLRNDGIAARVVSMPCWELFNEQDDAYRASVLSPDIPVRLGIEASCRTGWGRYYVGAGARHTIGIDRFGASAPSKKLLEEFGFTAENVASIARQLLNV